MGTTGRPLELVLEMVYSGLKEEYRDVAGFVCTACLVVVAVFYNEIVSYFLSFVASKSARRNDKEMRRQARQQKKQLRALEKQLQRHLRDLQRKEAKQRKEAEGQAASEEVSTKEPVEERVDALATNRREQLFDESTSPTQSVQSSFEHLASGSNEHFNDSSNMYQSRDDDGDIDKADSKLKLDESEEMETAQLSTSERMDDCSDHLSDHLSIDSGGHLAGVVDSYGSLPFNASLESLPTPEPSPDDGDDTSDGGTQGKRNRFSSMESLPSLADYDKDNNSTKWAPVLGSTSSDNSLQTKKHDAGRRKSVVTISLDDRPMGENSKSSDTTIPETKPSVDVERFKSISNSMRTSVRRRASVRNLHASSSSMRYGGGAAAAGNRSNTALLSVTEVAALVSEDVASTDSESRDHFLPKRTLPSRSSSLHSQSSRAQRMRSGRSSDGISPARGGLSQLKINGGSVSSRNMLTGKAMRSLGKKMRSERALTKPRKQLSFGSKEHSHQHHHHHHHHSSKQAAAAGHGSGGAGKRGSIIDRVRSFKQIKEELRHMDSGEITAEEHHQPPRRQQQRRLSIGDEMILNQIQQQPQKKSIPGRHVVSFDRAKATGNPALSNDIKDALGYG